MGAYVVWAPKLKAQIKENWCIIYFTKHLPQLFRTFLTTYIYHRCIIYIIESRFLSFELTVCQSNFWIQQCVSKWYFAYLAFVREHYLRLYLHYGHFTIISLRPWFKTRPRSCKETNSILNILVNDVRKQKIFVWFQTFFSIPNTTKKMQRIFHENLRWLVRHLCEIFWGTAKQCEKNIDIFFLI